MAPPSMRQKPKTKSAIHTLPFQRMAPFGWLTPFATNVPGEANALLIQHSARIAATRALLHIKVFPGRGETILLLGDCEGVQFIFFSSSLLPSFLFSARHPGIVATEGLWLPDFKARQPVKNYCRNSVMPEVAEPPPLEVMVTRLGAAMFAKVMENVPGAAGIAGPITPVQGWPVAWLITSSVTVRITFGVTSVAVITRRAFAWR